MLATLLGVTQRSPSCRAGVIRSDAIKTQNSALVATGKPLKTGFLAPALVSSSAVTPVASVVSSGHEG